MLVGNTTRRRGHSASHTIRRQRTIRRHPAAQRGAVLLVNCVLGFLVIVFTASPLTHSLRSIAR